MDHQIAKIRVTLHGFGEILDQNPRTLMIIDETGAWLTINL